MLRVVESFTTFWQLDIVSKVITHIKISLVGNYLITFNILLPFWEQCVIQILKG